MSIEYAFECRNLTAGNLQLVSFRGTERLSRPYRFNILLRVACSDVATLEHTLVGQRAALILGGAIGRTISGVITRASIRGVTGDRHGVHHCKVELVPRLRLLGHGKNSRIFQHQTVMQMVDAVLEPKGIERDWKLSREYVQREYRVQYQESDLCFIERTLAEEGVFYFFEHRQQGERVVFCDEGRLLTPIAGDATLEFSDSEGGELEKAERVHEFWAQTRTATGRVAVQRFDFERFRLPMTNASEVKTQDDEFHAPNYETFDHERIFDGVEPDHGIGQQQLEQHRRKVQSGTGASHCARLVPGHWFELSGNPLDGLNRRYLVTEVRHRGQVPEHRSAPSASDLYTNRFVCSPTELTPRPRRPKRAVRQLLETATVVGPEGRDIYTDRHGRVKVQFHWDREGQLDQHSSCWLRTAQTWAGAGWGTQFIPRIGMEVLVQCLGGDPDFPVVIGCLNNSSNPSTHSLPRWKTVSGIRTRTIGGGGYNELSFDDRPGQERVVLRAQNDLDELAGNNCTRTVANDEVIRVGASQVVHVGGNRIDLVGGESVQNVFAQRSVKVGGDESYAVDGGRSHSVAGSEHSDVGRDEYRTVRADSKLFVEGKRNVRVRGCCELLVGDDDADAKMATAVFGDYEVASSKTVTLDALEGLVLRSGNATMVIGPDEIIFHAPKIRLVSDEQTQFVNGGSEVKLDSSQLYLNSPEVDLHSTGSSLTLNGNALLRGATVNLDTGGGQTGKAAAEDDAAELETLRLKMSSPTGQPHANKRYELLVSGHRFKNTTDDEGLVQEDVPVSATSAQLTLWLSDEVKREFQLELNELEPVSAVVGAQKRLRTLGYYHGELTGELDRGTRGALRHFQQDHELELSGDIDEQTQGILARCALG